MRRLLTLASLVLALGAPSANAAVFDDEAIDDCLEATPHAVNVPFGDLIELRVLVLLDGVTEGQAAAAMSTEKSSYEPMGIDLTVARYQAVSFDAVDSLELIGEARALVGGQRPPWAHLVYTFTSKDMTGSLGSAVAGQADCIGGVEFDESAFAVGELRESSDADQPAKIGAHELGHLMGAHHHYANCAEGVTPDPLYPCTLMINDVGLASLNFSTFNAAVVRGHAEEFAKPLPPVPGPGASPGPQPTPAPSPAPTATPSGSSQPAPTPAPSQGSEPQQSAPHSGGAAPEPSSSAPSTGCSGARSALTRAKRAETTARRARAKARTAAARRRAVKKLATRVAARRAAERSVRARCS